MISIIIIKSIIINIEEYKILTIVNKMGKNGHKNG